MEALYLLIPLSVVAMFAAAWVFLKMSDSGQFDDVEGPAWSILHDHDRPAAEGTPAEGTSAEGTPPPSAPTGRTPDASA